LKAGVFEAVKESVIRYNEGKDFRDEMQVLKKIRFFQELAAVEIARSSGVGEGGLEGGGSENFGANWTRFKAIFDCGGLKNSIRNFPEIFRLNLTDRELD
jgi:hypothetical protein